MSYEYELLGPAAGSLPHLGIRLHLLILRAPVCPGWWGFGKFPGPFWDSCETRSSQPVQCFQQQSTADINNKLRLKTMMTDRPVCVRVQPGLKGTKNEQHLF